MWQTLTMWQSAGRWEYEVAANYLDGVFMSQSYTGNVRRKQ